MAEAKYPIRFPCPVRRLHVVWRKGKWSVENEIDIESMTLVRSDDLPTVPPGGGISGFWWEVVDSEGRVIYRQILLDPFRTGTEVFDKDRIRRVQPKMQKEVTFDVLIPDLPQVAEIHFYSSTRPNASGITHEHEHVGPAEKIAALDVRRQQGGHYGRC